MVIEIRTGVRPGADLDPVCTAPLPQSSALPECDTLALVTQSNPNALGVPLVRRRSRRVIFRAGPSTKNYSRDNRFPASARHIGTSRRFFFKRPIFQPLRLSPRLGPSGSFLIPSTESGQSKPRARQRGRTGPRE